MTSTWTPPTAPSGPAPEPVGGMDPELEANMRRSIGTANEAASKIETAMGEALQAFPTGDLSREVRDTYAEFTRKLSAPIASAEEAQHEAFRTLMDDRIAPDGRQRIARESIDRADATNAERIAEAETALQVLTAQLESEAIGTPDRRREQLARDEAAMLLDRAEDKTAAMMRLAADPDPDLRAVVAGPWGRRYLEAADTKNGASIHAGPVRARAIETAMQHGVTPQARAAAAAIAQLPKLAAARAASRSAASARLSPFTPR